MTLADQIRTRRTEQGLSKAALARRARISAAYLGQLENPAHRSSPSADVLIRIAGALGTSLAELMGKTLVGTSDVEVIVPDELRLLALEVGIPEMDVLMLARIEWCGRSPHTQEDYWFLYESIKRACRAK